MRNPFNRTAAIAAVAGLAGVGVGVGLTAGAQAGAAPTLDQQSAPLSRLDSSGYQVARKTYWVIQTRPVDAKKEEQFFRQHMDRQMRLEKEGVLFLAGPATQVDGQDRYGLIVIRADSEAEARRIAESDPMHMNGARQYQLYKWLLNEASLDMKVTLSDGKVEFE